MKRFKYKLLGRGLFYTNRGEIKRHIKIGTYYSISYLKVKVLYNIYFIND